MLVLRVRICMYNIFIWFYWLASAFLSDFEHLFTCLWDCLLRTSSGINRIPNAPYKHTHGHKYLRDETKKKSSSAAAKWNLMNIELVKYHMVSVYSSVRCHRITHNWDSHSDWRNMAQSKTAAAVLLHIVTHQYNYFICSLHFQSIGYAFFL